MALSSPEASQGMMAVVPTWTENISPSCLWITVGSRHAEEKLIMDSNSNTVNCKLLVQNANANLTVIVAYSVERTPHTSIYNLH